MQPRHPRTHTGPLWLQLLAAAVLFLAAVAAPSCRSERDKPREQERASAQATQSEDGSTPSAPEARRARPAALAGSWYSADPTKLRADIAGYMAKAGSAKVAEPIALIVPHAGHKWSGPVAAHSYATIRDKAYRRIFVLAPAHRAYLSGAAVPSTTVFETPLGDVPIDTRVTKALAGKDLVRMADDPHAKEHSIEIQLPFLQETVRPGFKLVPIVIGSLDLDGARRLASEIRPFVGPRDLVIASSDFTHYGKSYGYVPFTDDLPNRLRSLDMGAYEAIRTIDPATLADYHDRTGITACGYRPMLALLSMLHVDTKATLLRYETSGGQSNDYSRSVSYLSIAFTGPRWTSKDDPSLHHASVRKLTQKERKTALRLARTVLERKLATGSHPAPSELGAGDGVFAEKLGVFVTLKKSGKLRGCIGNIWPVAPLGEGIAGRAVDAALHDRRFQPVTIDELAGLEVEISVLSNPAPVASYTDIVIGRHGIVLQRDRRRAVFLPQVAPEQGWSLEETLQHLSRKAGLSNDGWRDGAKFQVFEAQVFSEHSP